MPDQLSFLLWQDNWLGGLRVYNRPTISWLQKGFWHGAIPHSLKEAVERQEIAQNNFGRWLFERQQVTNNN